MDKSQLQEAVAILEALLEAAVWVEKIVPDPKAGKPKASWPDYQHSKEDRRYWLDVEVFRLLPTSKQREFWQRVKEDWLNLLGTKRDRRTIHGKLIVWKKACGTSNREIGKELHISHPTVKSHYETDIIILTKKLQKDYHYRGYVERLIKGKLLCD